MKTCIISFAFVLCGIASFGQNEFTMKEGDTTYTMKKYFLCLLKKGGNRIQDSLASAKIQEGHMAHLNMLAQNGYACIAGPLDGDNDIRGIVIYNVATKEEAEKLATEDPAVKAGRLKAEVYGWWAAKGSVLK